LGEEEVGVGGRKLWFTVRAREDMAQTLYVQFARGSKGG